MARKAFIFCFVGLIVLIALCSVRVAAQREGEDATAQESPQSSTEPEAEAEAEAKEEAVAETEKDTEERPKKHSEEHTKRHAQEVSLDKEVKEGEADDEGDDEENVLEADPECVKPLKYMFEGDCKEAGLESVSIVDNESGRAYLEDIDKTAHSKWQEAADARHIVQAEKCKAPYLRHLCTANITHCQRQKKVKICFSTCVELSMACYGLSLQNALRRCRASDGHAAKGDDQCLHEVKLNLRHINFDDV